MRSIFIKSLRIRLLLVCSIHYIVCTRFFSCFSYLASTRVILNTPFSWGHLKTWSRKPDQKVDRMSKDWTLEIPPALEPPERREQSTCLGELQTSQSVPLSISWGLNFRVFSQGWSVDPMRLLMPGRSATFAIPPTPKSRVGLCRKYIWQRKSKNRIWYLICPNSTPASRQQAAASGAAVLRQSSDCRGGKGPSQKLASLSNSP